MSTEEIFLLPHVFSNLQNMCDKIKFPSDLISSVQYSLSLFLSLSLTHTHTRAHTHTISE